MASFPDEILDENEHRGARLVALALLADAAAQRERLGRDDDPEALHDFRVAVRRLRSWLDAQSGVLGAGAPRRARKWLRRLARATNHSRDAEVFAAWLEEARPSLTARQRTGLNWLLARVQDSRSAGVREATDEVARDFARTQELLEERLPVYHVVHHVDDGARLATFAGEMAALVRSHLAALLRRLDAVRTMADDAAAHRARIAGKRLRYLLEPIVPHVPEGEETLARLKSLQDTLGDFHDAHVWLALVREAIEAAASEEGRELARSARIDPPRQKSRGRGGTRDPRPGLLALAEQVRERAQRRFDTIRAEWMGDAAEPLYEGIERIVGALDERARSGVEIERKYLLSALPADIPASEVRDMEQGYLPGRRLVERLRRTVTDGEVRCWRTVKLGAGIARTEIEERCDDSLFDALWPLTEGRRLTKRRHVAPTGPLSWEIDEFTDRDLVLAEIELPSPDVVPDIPEWLAPYVVREVTMEAEYVNANLAR